MDFKKSLALFLCLALLLTSGLGAALASAKVSAKILSLEGDVQVLRAGGEKPFKAFANMRLTEGDQVITGTDGIAEIQMDDEVVITLVENTRIYLSELRGSGGAQQSSIGLQAGGVGSSVNKKLEENSRFEIKTPTAVMGVRGTEFFTQYFSGNIDIRVVDGIVEVTVELSETGEVTPGSGSTWSGSGAGSGAAPGDPSAPGAEIFTFELGPLSQILFGEGAEGTRLQNQITELTLQGLSERFIERIQEIEKEQPGKIPESIMDKIGEAIQKDLDRLKELEEVAKENLAEYDFRYLADIIDGDLERDLPGFVPEGMEVPNLDPEPTSGGSGGGGATDPGGHGQPGQYSDDLFTAQMNYKNTDYYEESFADVINVYVGYDQISLMMVSDEDVEYTVSASDDSKVTIIQEEPNIFLINLNVPTDYPNHLLITIRGVSDPLTGADPIYRDVVITLNIIAA